SYLKENIDMTDYLEIYFSNLTEITIIKRFNSSDDVEISFEENELLKIFKVVDKHRQAKSTSEETAEDDLNEENEADEGEEDNDEKQDEVNKKINVDAEEFYDEIILLIDHL